MAERLLRLGLSAAAKQKRLEGLLAARGPGAGEPLAALVEDAQLCGSLQLSGFDVSWEQVRAARSGDSDLPAELLRLRRARAAVPAGERLGSAALLAWHAAATGRPEGFRRAPLERAFGPPAAPPEFVESRLDLLLGWLHGESGAELPPARLGALALARLVEIAPFAEANGRVARLCASHLMERAGARPPVLVGADRDALAGALQDAFRLHTEPLAVLLEAASERALDVMLQALEGRGGP